MLLLGIGCFDFASLKSQTVALFSPESFESRGTAHIGSGISQT